MKYRHGISGTSYASHAVLFLLSKILLDKKMSLHKKTSLKAVFLFILY